MADRWIIHLDMDAFYASVEVLDNPDLKGRPVIVGGTKERGVVSAASYEARSFGVHSALPIATARRLCPHGVYLPVRMERYKAVSDRIFEIFRRYTPLVEPLSLDEAFLDVTGSIRLFGSPPQIAQTIRERVRAEIGLTVSAGVAPSKLVAKIASDVNKPDGLTVVPKDGSAAFLAALPIGRLWGVGRVSRRKLELMGIVTIGDLAALPLSFLEKTFGRSGLELGRLARGEDDRGVEPDREVKSIGAEETMAKDLIRMADVKKELLWLATRVTRRLRRNGFLGRTVTLKVKYQDFQQITRSETLSRPTDEARTVYETVLGLLEKTSAGHRPIRLLGISLSGLGGRDESGQAFLFDDPEQKDKARRLDMALDRITGKYGSRSVLPASLFEETDPHAPKRR
jgi:DNA polymerase-4